MSKVRNVTTNDLGAAIRMMEEAHAEIDALADTLRKGYCDPIDDPVAKARSFAALAKSASGLVHAILVQAGMDQMQRKIDTLS